MKDIPVYIIDPSPVQGNFLKYHLNASGIRNVRLFQSPDECLANMSREKSQGFILADTALKNISDIELTLKVHQSKANVKLVFYSDTDDPSHADYLLSIGATDFILKSHSSQNWIRELISNLHFLIRENIPVG